MQENAPFFMSDILLLLRVRLTGQLGRLTEAGPVRAPDCCTPPCTRCAPSGAMAGQSEERERQQQGQLHCGLSGSNRVRQANGGPSQRTGPVCQQNAPLSTTVSLPCRPPLPLL